MRYSMPTFSFNQKVIIDWISKRGRRFVYQIHSVQMPRWDRSQQLSQLIILLNVPPWSQIKSPLPMHEKVFFTGRTETLSPAIFEKINGLHWNRLSLWNIFTTCLMRFHFKNSPMDTGHMVSLLNHLNWPGFFENSLTPNSIQQSQVKTSMNIPELKCLSLWQATAKYLEKKIFCVHLIFQETQRWAEVW